MSTKLKQIFEQVHKLSRAEQLLLISSIAQLLSKEEPEQLSGDTSLQSIPFLKPVITKGDKSIDPKGLFGIWSGNPRTLQGIRQKAWERN